MKQYFAPKTAAERYHRGRPPYHHLSIDQIINYIDYPIERALDIACGTGLSTVALADRVGEVIGIDKSEAMLSFAKTRPNITYKLGSAEAIQEADQSVDLITVASGLHWFAFDAFFAEAKRVLKKNAYLVVYENYYPGDTLSLGEGFKDWYRNQYAKKFVAPPRNKFNFNDDAQISGYGFKKVYRIAYQNPVEWTRAQFLLYLTTQSNVISNVELGNFTIEEVEKWLDQELSSFMNEEEKQGFIFGNYIVFFQLQ